jgi:CBS domain-containing membrane protein
VLRGVGLRLRWRRLAEYHDARLPLGLLALINGAVSIGLMAVAARLTREPLVFPSLGPTAFLLFYRPHAEASCPRNALLGHLIGALSGLGALAVFGLIHQGPALGHVSTSRIGAAAMSLGLTAAGMIWVGVPHPPAGATTLIVSLGFLHTPKAVAVLMAGVAVLVVQGLLVNRWAGIDYPIWSPHQVIRSHAGRQDSAERQSDGRIHLLHTVFVDAGGESPAEARAIERLRARLAAHAHELSCGPSKWTGIFTVEAADTDQAEGIVRRRVAAAQAGAGLDDWRCACYEVHATALRLDEEPAHRHARGPDQRRAVPRSRR